MRIFFLYLFFLSGTLFAQDTLVLKMQGALPVIITEVHETKILYKKFADPFGPVYGAQKSSVSYIRYEKGTKENIDSLYQLEQPAPWQVESKPIYDSLGKYQRGDNHARIYYDSKCGAYGTFLATTFLVGVGGLISAIICSSVAPKTKNLKYPSEKLWADAYYQKGYRDRAKKIKQKKVWLGFAGGMASIVSSAIIYDLMYNVR